MALGALLVVTIGFAVSWLVPDPLTLTPPMEARTSPGLLDRGPTPPAGTKELATEVAKAFGAPVSLGLDYTRMDTPTVSAEPYRARRIMQQATRRRLVRA